VGIARSWHQPRGQLQGLAVEQVEADFSDPATTPESVVSKLGNLDALVVTAGYGHPGVIWNLPRTEIDAMVWANLHLPALILQTAIHCTKHIVLTGSIAGVRPREGSSVYSATKAGVSAMAESARRELPDHKIQTINFDNVDSVGPRKVLAAYTFLLQTPGNFDVVLAR
jgi:NADP-dependent 3-hydroxy acid dehydrogenase YdfG